MLDSYLVVLAGSKLKLKVHNETLVIRHSKDHLRKQREVIYQLPQMKYLMQRSFVFSSKISKKLKQRKKTSNYHSFQFLFKGHINSHIHKHSHPSPKCQGQNLNFLPPELVLPAMLGQLWEASLVRVLSILVTILPP